MEYTNKSKKIKRFLYNLGFEFKLNKLDQEEHYIFQETKELKEAVDFYYRIRKTFQK